MASEQAVSEVLQKSKVTLYWLEKSRSQRILWLLEECNIDYEVKTYKRQSNKLADPELKKIHPLGKSPVIGIETPDTKEPVILAESGLITEYLASHFAPHLVPKQWQDGKEGQVCGETEGYLRYRYFMHYAEGSLMSLMVASLLISSIKDSPVPFFIRPITRGITQKFEDLYFGPNYKAHFGFLEGQLASSPDGGEYLCGKDLSAVDILMSFPMIAAKSRAGVTQEAYPTLFAYITRLEENEGYKKSIKKIEELTGEPFNPIL